MSETTGFKDELSNEEYFTDESKREMKYSLLAEADNVLYEYMHTHHGDATATLDAFEIASDKSRKLREQARRLGHGYHAGQQIIVTRDYQWHENHWHRKGEIHIVNHDMDETEVWTTHNGKGATLHRRFTRAATPQDAGYRITKEEWDAYVKPVSKSHFALLVFISVYLTITCVMLVG